MIDIIRIKESYSSMLDSQLINIAIQDGHTLTPDAFQILKQEFVKRGLDSSYIDSVDQRKQEIHEAEILKVTESTTEEYVKLIWKYILDEKEHGASDDSIMQGLSERGLEESQAQEMLATINDKVKEIIDKNDTRVLFGGGSFVLGVFITLATYSQARLQGGVYVVAWGAIIFGTIGFFKGLSEKRKYKALLTKINPEIRTNAGL